MAFQSYLENRGFNPTKVADTTNKILTRASDIIEQTQAVDEIKYRQQANLINNLRSQRQREAQINSENHQLMMESLKTAEAVRSQDAQTQLIAAQKKEDFYRQQGAAQLEGVIKFAQAGVSMVAEAAQQQKQEDKIEYEQTFRDVINNPDKYAEQALALGVKLDKLKGAELAKAAQSIALEQVQPKNIWEQFTFDESALSAFGQKIAIENATTEFINGGLDTLILTQPDKEISFLLNGEATSIRLGDINEQEPVTYRAAMNAVFETHMKPFVGGVDNPALIVESSKNYQNFVNSKVVQRNREKIALNRDLRLNQRQELMFAEGPSGIRKYVSESTVFGRSISEAKNDVIRNLKFAPNPRQLVEEYGAQPDYANPNVTIGRRDPETGEPIDLHYRQLQAEVINIERQEALAKADTARINGQKLGKQAGEIAVKDGVFSETEMNQSRKRAQQMVESGKMSGEEYMYFNESVSRFYNDFSDRKAALKQLTEDEANYNLDPVEIRDLVNKGVIPVGTGEQYIKKAIEQASPDEPGALGYSVEDVFKKFEKQRAKKIKAIDTTNQPSYHRSATAGALSDVSDYKQLVKELMSKGATKAEAQQQAYNNIATAIDNAKVGTKYEYTKENLAPGQQPFYNQFTVGNHKNSYTATESDFNAADVGRQIADRPELLKSTSFNILDGHLSNIARQINSGEPVRLTKFAEDTWKASGLSFEEFWNPLLNREDSPYKGLKVSPGSYGEVQKQIEKTNPELTKLFDNLTTERKNVLLSKTNMVSSELGQGRSFFYGAQDAIGRMGDIKHKNVVAAIAYLRHGGNSQFMESLPELAKSINSEFNVDSYPTPTEFLAQLPPALQRDVNQVLGSTHSFSLAHAPGMTPSNIRLQKTQRKKVIKDQTFALAKRLGVDPYDLATLFAYESANDYLTGANRHGLDTGGGMYKDGSGAGSFLGPIQFSTDRQKEFGYTKGMSVEDSFDRIYQYFYKLGIRPGDGFNELYQVVQAPAFLSDLRKDGVVRGSDINASVADHIKNMNENFRPKAINFLNSD